MYMVGISPLFQAAQLNELTSSDHLVGRLVHENVRKAQAYLQAPLNGILRRSKHWLYDNFVPIQVGDNRCLLQSLKDSPYYRSFQDKVRSKA